jgi:hypothetical protein
VTTDDRPSDDSLIGNYPKMSVRMPRPGPQLIVSNAKTFPRRALLDEATLRRTLRGLVEAGRLPLAGETNLEHFVRRQGKNLTRAFDNLISSEAPVDPLNVLSLGTSLSRMLRLYPELRASLFRFEKMLLAITRTPEFDDYINGKFEEDHAKYLRRLVLEFEHLHVVGKTQFDEDHTTRPNWEAALALDLPNIAVNLISTEVNQLCSLGHVESALDLYQRAGMRLVKKYYDFPIAHIAVAMGRKENADLSTLTCIGNLYAAVASAHMISAALEAGRSRASSVRWAHTFMELAKASFCAVRPTWSHGLANLQLICYTEHRIMGNSGQAQYFWQTGHNQLRLCNDIRRSTKMQALNQDDTKFVEELLIR